MKSIFAADIKAEQNIDELFLVRTRETPTSAKSGRRWLQIVFVDKTGSIDGKMWDNFEEAAKICQPQCVVRVKGRTKTYQDRVEMTIDRISIALEKDYDLADFVAHTSSNVDELFNELREEVRAMKNPWLQKLLQSFLDDPEIASKMRRAPAAMTMHHAYVGGLIEHVASLCKLARKVSDHYPEVDHDLLLTGVILHDIGKTEELTGETSISYSDEGRLLGHITIGAGMTQKKIAAIPEFPPKLALLVEHMVLSHHGSLEFGAPVLPRFREAVLLNHLDDMDSKMASMRATLAAPPSDGPWSSRNPALRRELLGVEAFLKPPTPTAGQPGKSASLPFNPALPSSVAKNLKNR